MRFFPYLGALLAVLLAVFALSSSNVTVLVRQPVPAASSTLAVLPAIAPAMNGFNDLIPALVASTSEKSKTSVPTPPAHPSVPIKAPIVVATPPASTPSPPVSSGNISLDVVATALRGALVNILCYAPAGSSIRSISGSGIIIDPRGVILTNSHVAQMFLLSNRGVDCTIRTGSPASDAYDAAPMFISPAWIHANAAVLSEESPESDGEHDYALLAITDSATNAPLPTSFPFVPLSRLEVAENDPVVIASYGAQFLQTDQIESSLYPTLVFGSVKTIYTFTTNTIDVLALGGSAAAQEGSSGGGVADASGDLVGTITTSTVSGDTDTRNVNAISASYIRRAYTEETGTSLDTLLASTPANSVSGFASQIPALEAIITADLAN